MCDKISIANILIEFIDTYLWIDLNVILFNRIALPIMKYEIKYENRWTILFSSNWCSFFRKNLKFILKVTGSHKKWNIFMIKLYYIYYIIRCTTLFPPFFVDIRGFIVKNWLYIYDSKYCPSQATTFSHLSGSVRIPRRKNCSSFEAIHVSFQFLTSS